MIIHDMWLRFCRKCGSAWLILTCLITGGNLVAQPTAKEWKGGFGQMETGPNFLKLTALNQALDSELYLPLGETFYTLGLSLNQFRKRWIYGGELYNYMIRKSELNKQRATLSYHYGLLRTGMIVYRSPNDMLLYPSFGLGFGLGQLRKKEADAMLPDKHWTGGPLFDAALSAHFFSPLDEQQSLVWGLRVGFLGSMQTGWQLTGFAGGEPGIPMAPDGFYFRLSLGMGSIR